MPGFDLLDLLDRYEAAYPTEAPTVARIRDLQRSRPDCYERTCYEPGHLTASAWIVSPDGRRCLLTLHRKLGRWLQLGGHADGETDLLRSALRESREESGLGRFAVPGADLPTGGAAGAAAARGVGLLPLLDLDVHAIPARPGEPAHEHHDVRFLLVAADGSGIRASEESRDLRWFAWDEVPRANPEESLLRLGRKARAVIEAGALRLDGRGGRSGAP